MCGYPDIYPDKFAGDQPSACSRAAAVQQDVCRECSEPCFIAASTAASLIARVAAAACICLSRGGSAGLGKWKGGVCGGKEGSGAASGCSRRFQLTAREAPVAPLHAECTCGRTSPEGFRLFCRLCSHSP